MTRTDAEKARSEPKDFTHTQLAKQIVKASRDRERAEKAVRERPHSKESQILELMGALSFIVGYAKSAAADTYDHEPRYYRESFAQIAGKADEALENWREMVTLETGAAYRKQTGDSVATYKRRADERNQTSDVGADLPHI